MIVNNPWFAIKTEGSKEMLVSRAIVRAGFEIFLATEIRSYRPTKKTRRRVCVEVILIPRIVFAWAPKGELDTLSGLRHATGIVRDGLLLPLAIPDAQMRTFMAYHAEWLERERKRQAAGQPAPKRKRKWLKLEENTLAEVAKEYFGVDELVAAA